MNGWKKHPNHPPAPSLIKAGEKIPVRLPVTVLLDEETYTALTESAAAIGVSRAKLAAETLTVALGGNRPCALS